jgi:hypothetical protein
MTLKSVGRLIAIALVVGLSISVLIFAVTDWRLSDAEAYWNAAIRLREGQPLYPPVNDPEASTVYRYSPWFAFAAIPFTYVPQGLAAAIWSLMLVAASGYSVTSLAKRGHRVQALFFGSVLIGISAIGNAQPLIVAGLVYGLERRSGPVWIAVAASLKVVPIVFAVVYLGRREWGRFGITAALTIVLVAPMLLFDLSNYVTDPAQAAFLIQWPPVWLVAVGVGALVTLRLADSPFGWLAAGTTAALALPRFFVYDVTFLLPGTVPATPAAVPTIDDEGIQAG